MADNESSDMVPGARMKLSDSMKKLANGIKMYVNKTYTEDNGGEVEVHEAVKDGIVTGRYVKKGDQVVETMSTPDAQSSGDADKQAKAAGVKKEQTTVTDVTQVARGLNDDTPKVGELGSNQSEGAVKADLSGKTKEVKPKDPKDGKKPDSSMSKMASQKTGELEKSYEIKREGDTLHYNQKKVGDSVSPKEPPMWKQKWDAKPQHEKDQFKAKLSAQRSASSKPVTIPKPAKPKAPALAKADEKKPTVEIVPHPKEVIDVDPKIINDMKARLGQKPLKLVKGMDFLKCMQAHVEKLTKADEIQAHAADAPKAAQPEMATATPTPVAKEKPHLIKEMMRYKQHTASGRPFRVMGGSHPDHKNLIGAHYVLEKAMQPREIDAELKKPTSPLSRKVLDAVDEGHDSLYVHQPESMKKGTIIGNPGNAIVGAAPMAMSKGSDWKPTPHTSRPEKMNQSQDAVKKRYNRRTNKGETKAKKVEAVLKKTNHQEYAAKLHQRVQDWASGRGQRKEAAEQIGQHVNQIMSAHNASGGSTTNLKTGPVSGDLYSVSPYLDRSQVIAGPLQPQHLHDYIKQNQDLLSKPDHHLGTWHDPETKQTFLDVGVTTPDKNKAIQLAQKHNQKAIFHLGTMTTIPTGGTGLK